ncbi:hypothetical protein [Streptomyces sp. ME109]|uniref:hypothetical protein n=1 Tax=Streptomyces sp. me109 TaxID=1827853 RepID=UPI00165167CC
MSVRRTAAAVASALAARAPRLSGWYAKPPASLPSPSHPTESFTSASYGDPPCPERTSAGFRPAAASAPTTTDVEFASLAPPAV